jgi:hypothetical protein
LRYLGGFNGCVLSGTVVDCCVAVFVARFST